MFPNVKPTEKGKNIENLQRILIFLKKNVNYWIISNIVISLENYISFVDVTLWQ